MPLSSRGYRTGNIPESTKSDVIALKTEIHDLMRERTLLKANLVRLRDNLKDPRSHAITQGMLTNTAQDIKKITDYNASRRSDIAALLASDTAAAVSENQEESLLLYQELLRTSSIRRDAESRLKQINEEINALAHAYSAEKLNHSALKLAQLEAQIVKQQERNASLIKSISVARADASKKSQTQPNPAITSLEERVRQEEDINAQLDLQIAIQRAKYESELQEIEGSLCEFTGNSCACAQETAGSHKDTA